MGTGISRHRNKWAYILSGHRDKLAQRWPRRHAYTPTNGAEANGTVLENITVCRCSVTTDA